MNQFDEEEWINDHLKPMNSLNYKLRFNHTGYSYNTKVEGEEYEEVTSNGETKYFWPDRRNRISLQSRMGYNLYFLLIFKQLTEDQKKMLIKATAKQLPVALIIAFGITYLLIMPFFLAAGIAFSTTLLAATVVMPALLLSFALYNAPFSYASKRIIRGILTIILSAISLGLIFLLPLAGILPIITMAVSVPMILSAFFMVTHQLFQKIRQPFIRKILSSLIITMTLALFGFIIFYSIGFVAVGIILSPTLTPLAFFTLLPKAALQALLIPVGTMPLIGVIGIVVGTVVGIALIIFIILKIWFNRAEIGKFFKALGKQEENYKKIDGTVTTMLPQTREINNMQEEEEEEKLKEQQIYRRPTVLPLTSNNMNNKDDNHDDDNNIKNDDDDREAIYKGVSIVNKYAKTRNIELSTYTGGLLNLVIKAMIDFENNPNNEDILSFIDLSFIDVNDKITTQLENEIKNQPKLG